MALLDDFNRANNANLGANWTTITATAFGPKHLALTSNQAVATGGNYSDLWTAAIFPADQEAAITLRTIDTTAHTWVFLCVPNPAAASFTGYLLDLVHGVGTLSMTVYRGNSGSFTNLGSTSGISYATGDVWMLRKNGSTVTVLRNGTAVSGMTLTDSSPLVASGYAGFGGSTSGVASYDDFTGGAVGSVKFGSSTLTLTDSLTTIGKRTAFGASTMTESVAIVTVGSRKLFGSSTLTASVSIVTSGFRAARGVSSLVETVGIVTNARRDARGQSSLVEHALITTFMTTDRFRLRPAPASTIARTAADEEDFVLVPDPGDSILLIPA